MKASESASILAAIIILSAVFSFSSIVHGSFSAIPIVILFSAIVIFVSILAKKLMAYSLDADVEHELWRVYRYGWKPGWHFDKPVSAGIILPLFFSFFSWGLLQFSAILTYETRALKTRVARRFGYYSFAEMTEWHNSLVGAAGIASLLILSIVSYFAPFNWEYLAKIATIYAFWNMIPVSNLDGSQIFFGSRILYSILGIITIIFTLYAVLLH